MVNNLAKKATKISLSEDLEAFQNASGRDILKNLGPISREEYNYYENLKAKKLKNR